MLWSVVLSKITSYTSVLIPGATCDVEGVLRDTYLQRYWESFDSLAQDSSADAAFRFELWLSGPLSFGVFRAVGSHGSQVGSPDSQYFWTGGYRHLTSRTNRRLLEFERDLTFRNLEFARAQSSKYHSILLLQRDIVQKSSWDVWCFERKICKVATQYFSECDQIEKSISKNLEDIDSNLGAFDWFVSRSWSPSLLPVDPPVSLVSPSRDSPGAYQFSDPEKSD
ncbi:hypothetical protein CBD41_05430 [bacterium TMED181]|nr:MAG: hypothetical protein CBD41_05430 [bacterium TMED181]